MASAQLNGTTYEGYYALLNERGFLSTVILYAFVFNLLVFIGPEAAQIAEANRSVVIGFGVAFDPLLLGIAGTLISALFYGREIAPWKKMPILLFRQPSLEVLQAMLLVVGYVIGIQFHPVLAGFGNQI
ncbi:MAG: hypothetical protein AAF492_32330 [Verrucomicrobiota bacterium]